MDAAGYASLLSDAIDPSVSSAGSVSANILEPFQTPPPPRPIEAGNSSEGSAVPVHGNDGIQENRVGKEIDTIHDITPLVGSSDVLVEADVPLVKDFERVVVVGDPPHVPPIKMHKPPLDAHMPTATLRLRTIDRTTGEPVQNVAISVNILENVKQGKKKNYARSFGNQSRSLGDGTATLKLMCGVPYVVTATCDGFLKFGTMGEHLVVQFKDGEVVDRVISLIPLRITVVVTLRELQPLAGKHPQKNCPYGQVNPLYSAPPVDPLALITPQRVAFYSPHGTKMSYVASPLMAQGVLGVSVKPSGQRVGDYSTDASGHCYFYGERLEQTSPPKYRDPIFIDSGPWEYTAKYHLRANPESGPVQPRFDHYLQDVEYPAHVARFPPPKKALLTSLPFLAGREATSDTSPTRTSANRMKRPPLNSRGGRQQGSSLEPLQGESYASALTDEFLSAHRGLAEMIGQSPQPVHRANDSTGSGQGNTLLSNAYMSTHKDVAEMVQTPKEGGGGKRNKKRSPGPSTILHDYSDLVGPARAARYLGPVDRDGIQNYLLPGLYNLQLSDPSMLLIFYTYSPDNEQAEVNQAQDSIVPLTMPHLDDSFKKPDNGGNGRATDINIRFPVQLYCRARPWFQIVVYDIPTLSEVGTQFGFQFTIYRVDHNRSFQRKVEKLQQALHNHPHREMVDPMDLPEGQDPEVVAYLQKQLKRGKVHQLWALTETSCMQKDITLGEAFEAAIDANEDERYLMKDEEVFVPIYKGRLNEGLDRQHWITPGERYAVEVLCEDPCLELTLRQVRLCNWELEPFVFYTYQKVKLLVGVREVFNQAPISGMLVNISVEETPPLRRPPVVKQEWCEPAESYAQRILDQMIDFVVESRRLGLSDRINSVQNGVTDETGLAALHLAPWTRVTLCLEGGEEFDNVEEEVKTLTLGEEKEQFIGFQLHRNCYVHARCVDSQTGEGIEGFIIKAYEVTDRAARMPIKGLSPKQHETARARIEADLLGQCPRVRIRDCKAIYTARTGPGGLVELPVKLRAGRVVKLVVAKAPKEYCLPHYLTPGSNSCMVYTYYNTHSVTFECPPRPKVQVLALDSCTSEHVMGLRFRVCVRRTARPYIPEGEEEAEEAQRRKLEAAKRMAPDSLEASRTFGGLSGSKNAGQFAAVLGSAAAAAAGRGEVDDLAAIEEPTLDAGSIDEVRPRSSDGGEAPPVGDLGAEEDEPEDGNPGPMEEMTRQDWEDRPLQQTGEMGRTAADWWQTVGPNGIGRPLGAAAAGLGLGSGEINRQGKGLSGEMVGGTALNARALELMSGMEAPPPGARGPMRRRLEEVGNWAEEADQAAAEAAEAAAAAAAVLAAEASAERRKKDASGSKSRSVKNGGPNRLMYEASDITSDKTSDKSTAAGGKKGGPQNDNGDFDAEDDLAMSKVLAPEEMPLESLASSAAVNGGSQPATIPRMPSLLPGGLGASAGVKSALGKGGKKGGPVGRVSIADTKKLKYSFSDDGDEDDDDDMPPDPDEVEEEEFESQEEIWYDTFTGYPVCKTLYVDPDTEIRVQVLPCWPYMTQHQELVHCTDGWRSPPQYMFYLPRDYNAFMFWMERDSAMPNFWGEDGYPLLPPHPLSRLQPGAMPGALLMAPLDSSVKFLHKARPEDAIITTGATSGDEVSPLTSGQGGISGTPTNLTDAPSGTNQLVLGSRVQPSSPSNMKGRDKNDGGSATPAKRVGSGSTVAVAPPSPPKLWPLDNGDGEGGLHREQSALQFTEDDDWIEGIQAAAWQHHRLSDLQFLPIDRSRLMQLLVKWSAFPHIEGGFCKGCFGPSGPPPAPGADEKLSSGPGGLRWATARIGAGSGPGTGRNAFVATAALPTATSEMPLGDIYRSKLLGGKQIELSAPWAVVGVLTPAQQAAQAPPHPYHSSVPDKYNRTHTIVSKAEAVYCKSPFFTWRLASGSALHVGIHEGLYRELIPILDSVAASADFMRGHVDKVMAHNETRTKDGRFLFGHAIVEGCLGAVFILDDSAAMPEGAAAFMVDELAATLDYWHSKTATRGLDPPRYNLLLVSGPGFGTYMHTDGLEPVAAANGSILRAWYRKVRPKQSPAERPVGFTYSEVLRHTLAMADTQVPTVFICGGMVPKLPDTPKRVNWALYEAQINCINRQRPMQPVHTIEVYPMPKIDDVPPPEAATARQQQQQQGQPGTSGGECIGSEECQCDNCMAELSKMRGCMGNIFEKLQDAVSNGRMRLFDVFKEADKDADNVLNGEEMLRLVQRLIPEAGPAHARFLSLMLDNGGGKPTGRGCNCTKPCVHYPGSSASCGTGISYKELSLAVRAAAKAGLSVELDSKLEVTMILQRVAFLMLFKQKTVQEIFNDYDHNQDGFWDQVEQWRALKELFPGLTVEEQRQMFDAMQAMDINEDDRIGLDEFIRAMNKGGAVKLLGWGVEGGLALPHWADDTASVNSFSTAGPGGQRMQKKKPRTMEEREAEAQLRSRKIDLDFDLMSSTRKAGFPLTALLRRVSGTTRGSHRRLDMGRARAQAERINMTPVMSITNNLEKALKELVDFEAAYGVLLTADRAATSRTRLTADPPSSPPVGSAWRPGTAAASSSSASPQRQRPHQSANRSPQKSAIRRSRSAANLANIPSRLMDLTSTRNAYISDLSAQRGATPSSLLDAVSSRWRREPAGGRSGSEVGIATLSSHHSRPASPARLRPRSSNGTAEGSGRPGTAAAASPSQDRQEYTPTLVRRQPTERPSSAPAYRPRPQPRRESLLMNSAILELPDDAQTDRSGSSVSAAGLGAGALSTGGMVGAHQVAKLRGPAGFSSIISTTLRKAPETQPAFHF
ncbi:hypothetical protein CEUSTIGMA_g8858.t1 [Chlamydomonas eustigma]|uniref:EF-hand domain-containing protein n=1 Tax=Chlamydomonas eustigma TaxID=1157962 RepID=A0A250XEB6_9CHLO|nr:hypothetical protein CEUSTIGMA_g8858.t1 [Chlamydomonas eustigma]|eukprot:GAX81428.1 hypothetical protein CEUSTIGMA_g8858.t1 [Chlamydomonas eustigma]